MAYREIRVVEIREVLRLWLNGWGLRRIARVGIADRKTVRRYTELAVALGVRREGGVEQLTDELLGDLAGRLQPGAVGNHGAAWRVCETHRNKLQGWVDQDLKLSKVFQLLRRHVGPVVPERTFYRYVNSELRRPKRPRGTMRVDDCAPGQELQVDFGKMGLVTDPDAGRQRVAHALIFTAVYSRHQFVWLAFSQTLASVIEGFEAAWSFFGGVFPVVVPDNMSAMVRRADSRRPLFTEGFQEYASSRGFVVDQTRVRRPQDKPRVERAVEYVRGSFFAGEQFVDLADGRRRAAQWCIDVAGARIHGTTHREPLEVFLTESRSKLLPAPSAPYDLPTYTTVTVQKDQHVTVGKALYSVPERFIGEKLHARADRSLVRLSHKREVIKTHPRQPPGGRVSDPADFDEMRYLVATRDQEAFHAKATEAGPAVAEYSRRLAADLPVWRCIRCQLLLLGLVRRFGPTRVDAACTRALDLDVVDVNRIARMLAKALETEPNPPNPQPTNILTPRFSRPKSHFAIARTE